MTNEQIKSLKETDTYSLILFCLYKLIEIPEYSSLSELVYVLDKPNLLNLCEYFGGQTITIPTIDELETLTYSLLLYQYVNVEGKDYVEALELIGHESQDLRRVKKFYSKLCDVLSKYDDKITGVRYKNQIALSFHPELSNDTRLHELFLSITK